MGAGIRNTRPFEGGPARDSGATDYRSETARFKARGTPQKHPFQVPVNKSYLFLEARLAIF
jgi:hypothetical protein